MRLGIKSKLRNQEERVMDNLQWREIATILEEEYRQITAFAVPGKGMYQFK